MGRVESQLEKRARPAVHHQQRNSFFAPLPRFLVDEVHAQVLDLGCEVVPLGNGFLRGGPGVVVEPVVV
jgi:hypothetical protein